MGLIQGLFVLCHTVGVFVCVCLWEGGWHGGIFHLSCSPDKITKKWRERGRERQREGERRREREREKGMAAGLV